MRKGIAMRRLLVCQLVIVLLIIAANLAAERGQMPLASEQPAESVRLLSEEQQIVHLLNRAGFGPRPGDVEKVRRMGIQRYLELQLHPARIDDASTESTLRALKSLRMSSAELVANYPRPQKSPGLTEHGSPSGKPGSAFEDSDRLEMKSMKPDAPRRIIAELSQAKVLRAVYSERQLYEVMVDFWSNHFNVFAAKGANRWLTTAYDRDVIRPQAMGKFKDLLLATAKSPAMLFYLDNWMSVAPGTTFDLAKLQELRSRRLGGKSRLGGFGRRRRDEGKELKPVDPGQGKQRHGLNENYARELMELHTLGVDGGYTQKDITEVARCFTGWTIARPRQGGEFSFTRSLHDDGEKIVLGHRIPAGGGIRDGEKVIDLLVAHPSTARFIAAKLVRRFVADEPPASLVERVAKVFRGSEGDIPAMLRTIFVSQEFNSLAAYRSKVKTPFELVVSALRALGAETDGGTPILRVIAEMGEPLFLCQPPTGYPETAEAWVNTGALLQRLNFGLALANNQFPGTRVNLDLPAGEPGDGSEARLLKQFAQAILHNEVSAATLETLKQINAGNATKGDSAGVDRSINAAQLAGLVLGSPEFQRQ